MSTYALDEVKASAARANGVALLAAVVVAVGLTIWLRDRGWVSTIPLLAAGGIYASWAAEAGRRADAFNTFRVGRR